MNHSNWSHVEFILQGVPNGDGHHLVIFFAFMLVYIAILLANGTIMYLIKTEPRMHGLMYYLLCLLALIDVVLGNVTIPKLLAMYLSRSMLISLEACATQMFFVYCTALSESTLLVAMAYDRYVAICHPFRYHQLTLPRVLLAVGGVVLLRAACFAAVAALLTRATYCRSNYIENCYCNYGSLSKLACSGTLASDVITYPLSFLITLPDSSLIGYSYYKIFRVASRSGRGEARTKALNTCTTHICVLLLFYTSALFEFVMYLVPALFSAELHFVVAVTFVIFQPIFNPVIYGVRTTEIRNAFLKLLGRKRIAADGS
ncbi:olfactory receptor 52E2-like [Amblyraja radiata]|uniref:olfactory receptor 52E2-like n=1 Tax=Amblyraja radiata TaxID=386614 RepID=UPI001403F244|nr:olfactory receptor 52E2-like [Amblyraja radiata]